jgi:riboflavin kinase/FMN adenylyltransferase
MHVYGCSAHLPPATRHVAVGIGIFDGLHLGHRALLGRVLELARAEGLESVAYTFDPHPARLFSPATAPKLIERVECRLERLSALGIDVAVVEPFNRTFASMEAETFIRHVLVGKLGAKHVVVGRDFTFGRDRRGDAAMLQAFGRLLDFRVHPMPLVELDGQAVTSSAVRTAVTRGDMPLAGKLLGRPFCLCGLVMRGAQRGSQLGFPTANVGTHNELIPATGVYACRCKGPFGTALAVVNLGFSPTFDVQELRIEAHLLDFPDKPLYGAVLELDFIAKLRDEVRFDGVEALTEQIARDVTQARAVLTTAS